MADFLPTSLLYISILLTPGADMLRAASRASGSFPSGPTAGQGKGFAEGCDACKAKKIGRQVQGALNHSATVQGGRVRSDEACLLGPAPPAWT
jgi:hypothetical protein